MAFLDNSGDIVLDAVLTDTGRFRLAKGDGTFNIVKFALGDDEIDYGSYDKNNAGGQPYYALTILQTPILEAFSNNASSMKYRLLTLDRDNLLYLPVIKLYDSGDSSQFGSGASAMYIVAVDQTTVDSITIASELPDGVLNGFLPGLNKHLIIADQGLDTSAVSQEVPLDSDLVETQYLLELDNRLGRVVTPVGTTATDATLSFVDDDSVASYIMTLNSDTDYISELPTVVNATDDYTKLSGPVGTRLSLRLAAQTSLRTSAYLFTVLGNTGTDAIGSLDAADYKYIDTTLSVTGQTTGYRIDIPLRYVKKI